MPSLELLAILFMQLDPITQETLVACYPSPQSMLN